MSVPFHTCDQLADEPGLRHGFFTRNGGVSSGNFTSLNCAYGSGDAPENVAENRKRVLHTLGSSQLAKAYQIHSATAIIATEGWAHGTEPQADAVVTATPGLTVAVTTADCLPILLADPAKKVVAAAHAGWKGAFGGIIEATLEAMETLGASREGIIAAIGPSIAQGSYEVGPEFHERFIAEDAGNQLYFIHASRTGHWLFDLKSYAKERLRAAGVERVNVMPYDTCQENNEFFSYRRATLRQEGAYGCQLSAIVIAD